MKNEEKSFWITNLSNTDIGLSDLGVTIKANTSINLLDSKHYPYITLDILQKSENSGSLYKKKNKIAHRKFPPNVIIKKIPFDIQSTIPTRQRSIVEIKQEQYEELTITDDDLIANISSANNSTKEQ